MSTTIDKCLKTFDALARSDAPRGLSELARELDLDKSTVQRILLSLVENGYIEKIEDTARYRPTLKIWELGANVIARHEVRRLVHPVIRYGAAITELTLFFAGSFFPDVVYLDKVEGGRSRPSSSDAGRRVPMGRAASGKAILAFLEPNQIDLVARKLAEEGSEIDLQAELVEVRQSMFASSQSGMMGGINSVASPVWGAGASSPVGSIVISADAENLPSSEINRVGEIAVSLAVEATRVLDGSFPRSALHIA